MIYCPDIGFSLQKFRIAEIAFKVIQGHRKFREFHTPSAFELPLTVGISWRD